MLRSSIQSLIPSLLIPQQKTNLLEALIPPYKINYNAISKKNYLETFSQVFQAHYLPQLILYSGNEDLQSGSKLPKILDLGCGFAPMAHALAIAKQASKPLRVNTEIIEEDTTYLGIDIRKDAIDWLKEAYKDLPDFKFHYHETSKKADYVGSFKNNQANSLTFAHSDGSECRYNIGGNYQADIQWSGSFFTHLTYNAAFEALNFISDHLKSDGIAVNTWLIADIGSCLAMANGEADRKCLIDHDAYLTYSEENPLVCTVYKLTAMKELYSKAGLKIKHILRGSWRGSAINNPFNIYQDVVISSKYR